MHKNIIFPAYLDTNVLVNYLLKINPVKHKWVEKTLNYSRKYKERLYISLFSLIELWDVLLRYHLEVDGLIHRKGKDNKPRSVSEYFKQYDKSVIAIKYSAIIKRYTLIILGFNNLKVVPGRELFKNKTVSDLIEKSFENHKYNLLPMDNFHISTAILAGARSFVTSDSDFESINIKDITIVKY
ncbi:MAG: type II toxin-antitoxin system VapC family toxin [Candidatus Eremiobacterota bacterium]